MSSESRKRISLSDWFEDRLKLADCLKIAEKKQVPLHEHSIWYYMGGIAMILMAVQIATGILLMVHYIPSMDAAHACILKLNSQVDFGWFIRSLHSWGANLLIFVLFVHLFSTYFMKAYRRPREITWLTGIALLVLTMAFGFTGYLLPWDDVSFFATKIGLDIASKVPFIGEQVATLLRGGDSIGQATLSRFFMIHVAALPAVLLALMGGHILLVQLHGMSEPESFKKKDIEKRSYEKFFPNFLLKDVLVWLLALNALAVLVTLCPWGIGSEVDPYGPAPSGIKPEWYFLAEFQFLKLVPAQIGPMEGELAGVAFMGLLAAGLALIPFYDRGDSKLKSRLATIYGLALMIGLIAFTLWGALS